MICLHSQQMFKEKDPNPNELTCPAKTDPVVERSEGCEVSRVVCLVSDSKDCSATD